MGVTDTERGGAERGLRPGLQPGLSPDPTSGLDDGPLDRFRRWRESLRHRPTANRVYRIVVGLIGGAIVVGGFALVPLPGPGWLIVFLGLAILASEFEWAHRLERYARRQVSAWTHWLGRQHLVVRIVFGLLTAAFVAVVIYAGLRVLGVPDWAPDGLVLLVPGLTP